MTRFVLDTNHLSDTLKTVSPVRERIYHTHREGNRVGTCLPVLCEFEVGIQLLKRSESYRRALQQLFREVRLWPMERDVAEHYGAIYHELKQRGRVLSQVDMMLSALARSMNLVVLTADQDFEALPDVDVENWLA